MAFISSLDVTLWKADSIGKVLPLLLAEGWRFWEEEIRYKYFIEVGEEETVATALPAHWPSLVSEWDAQCAQGRTVELIFQWQDDRDKQVTTWFSRQDQPYLKVSFVMYPAWQRLCHNLTDYSWYLERLACPLERNDCGILEVTCSDDNG